MMLNILGLRMAGQISLRKTKPLGEEGVKHVRRNKNKHAKMKAGTRVNIYMFIDLFTPVYLTTLVRMVVFVGHFCCTDFCRQP